MSEHTPHPILAPALTRLRDAATWQPATPDDLAALLRTLNGTGDDNLITALGDLLDHLTETLHRVPGLNAAARALIATHLIRASERLSPVGESLDRARQELPGAWTP